MQWRKWPYTFMDCQIIVLHNKRFMYYYRVYHAAKRDIGMWLMSLHATILALPEYCL